MRSDERPPGASDERAAGWSSLFPLVCGSFLVACEGTILTGALPRVSADLDTGPSAVGAALAIYPVVYVLGSPLLAMLAGGRSQRSICTLGLLVFAMGNVVSASAGSVLALVVGRVVASIGAASYVPNAAARAMSLGAHRRGRVLSVLASGSTLATLAGAPVGIYLASLTSWRWVLVLIAVCAMGVAVAQRESKLTDGPVRAMGMRERLRFLRNRDLLSILALTFVVVLGEFVVYAYIALLAQHTIDADAAQVATALFVFGIGTTTGTLAGGFLVDRFTWPRVQWVSMAVTTGSMVILAFARTPLLLAACLLVWGVFGWTFTPSQTNRLISTFPTEGALLITLNGSAVHLGVAGGGLLGGAVHHVFGAGALAPTAALIIGSAFTAYALHGRNGGHRP